MNRENLKHIIKIRLVDVNDGEILFENKISCEFDLFYRRDKQVLHSYLDKFIETLCNDRAVYNGRDLYLEFYNSVDKYKVHQLPLPF